MPSDRITKVSRTTECYRQCRWNRGGGGGVGAGIGGEGGGWGEGASGGAQRGQRSVKAAPPIFVLGGEANICFCPPSSATYKTM